MSSSSVEYSIAPSASRDPFRDRQPPYSEDAELAVLSAMLMDQDAIVRASEILDDSMFYAERHRRVFRAMVGVAERGSVVDPLTLADELSRKGELDAAGGKDFIGYLVDAVPTSANIEYHAQIVREKAILRTLIQVSTQIVHDAFSGMSTAVELLDEAESKIFRCRSSAKPTASCASRNCCGPRWNASRRCSVAARPLRAWRAASPISTR